MLLIGSRALILRGIDTCRKPLDYDLIGTFDELGELTRGLRGGGQLKSIPLSANKTVLKRDDGLIVEFEIAWPDSTGAALEGTVWCPEIVSDPVMCHNRGQTRISVASVDELYSLKMSHRYLKNSPHFRKTRADILLMRANGARVHDPDWLKRREDETYWYRHPKLNVAKGDFFKGDGVQYVYDHDDIHKAVVHYIRGVDVSSIRPAYTLYMKDGEQVQCDRKKFEALPEYVRLNGVLEEAYVLALERSQIPFRGNVTPRRSFDIALQKVCTSITSGWFREYGWENFDKVEGLYDETYVERFWRAVEAGRVRKLEPGETPSY